MEAYRACRNLLLSLPTCPAVRKPCLEGLIKITPQLSFEILPTTHHKLWTAMIAKCVCSCTLTTKWKFLNQLAGI